MDEVLAGSAIVTRDGVIWYACGDWSLRHIENVVPCVPAYIPYHLLPDGVTTGKQLTIDNRLYAKVFGYHGLSLKQHRDYVFPKVMQNINVVTLGRVTFLDKQAIVRISNPMQFRETFLDKLEGSRPIFERLAEALGINIANMGISGSVLVIGTPSWRHEIDFSIMGSAECNVALSRYRENRLKGIFSKHSLPPYHMPFEFEGKWFDPHFSDPHKEKVLNGATIDFGDPLREVILRISDDTNGIFFPTFYGTLNGMRLLSFRPSHRGLYSKDDRVFFENIGTGVVTYKSGKSERVYLIVNEEWGEKI